MGRGDGLKRQNHALSCADPELGPSGQDRSAAPTLFRRDAQSDTEHSLDQIRVASSRLQLS
jgi:hypothetical protein